MAYDRRLNDPASGRVLYLVGAIVLLFLDTTLDGWLRWSVYALALVLVACMFVGATGLGILLAALPGTVAGLYWRLKAYLRDPRRHGSMALNRLSGQSRRRWPRFYR